MFFIIVLLGILILFFWWYTHAPAQVLPPSYPGSLPLIGHAHLLIGDGVYLWNLIQKIQNHCLENGGVTHLKLGPQLFYVICDAEDYFTVMENCLEKNYFYRKILTSWVGEGLVTAPVPVWKRHQKLLSPSFGQYVADGFIQVINNQARSLVQSLSVLAGKGQFDPSDYVARFALEANFLTAFGLELDENTAAQMETYIGAFNDLKRVMTRRIQTLWMHSDLLYSCTELKKQQDEAMKVTKALSDAIIKRKRELISKRAHSEDWSLNARRFKGFMDQLLELSEGAVLSDSEIRSHVDTMILAGYDTSATTATYACLMLGSYPDVQEKVYQELQAVSAESDRDVEKQDLTRLVYLDAVIKEVCRLFPSAPVVIRQVDKEVKLKNYTMPVGSNCAVLLSGVSRDKVWGEDRHEFRPERWFEDTLPDHAHAFIGFSTGRRACLGKPYAMNYMKITIAHLVRRYRMVADHRRLKIQLEIFLKPAEGCYLSLERREASV